MNYYNEHDPKAAAWLRELIAANLIAPGIVDERSITEVNADELADFIQCHFFAGIGGWSYALRLAGWTDDRPVWTGSCPCQPFSVAGQGKGGSDDRHLWPVFRRLVAVQRPERVFGEQVAQAIGFNWLDGISADLEADGYAVGAVVLGAHSVGAPHIRQRLYWMADRLDGRSQNGRAESHGQNPSRNRNGEADSDDMPKVAEYRGAGRVADMQREGLEGLAGNGNGGNQPGRIEADAPRHAAEGGAIGGMGNPESGGCGIVRDAAQPGSGGYPIGASWAGFDIIPCRDGKARRVESGTFPLVDGLPRGVVPSGDPGVQEAQASGESRVARLRGYGNAIIPQVAAQFILAFCDTVPQDT